MHQLFDLDTSRDVRQLISTDTVTEVEDVPTNHALDSGFLSCQFLPDDWQVRHLFSECTLYDGDGFGVTRVFQHCQMVIPPVSNHITFWWCLTGHGRRDRCGWHAWCAYRHQVHRHHVDLTSVVVERLLSLQRSPLVNLHRPRCRLRRV